MIPTWSFIEGSQKKMDRNSQTYDYLRKYGIVISEKEYNKLKKLYIQYKLPTKENGWNTRESSDPFVYDKLIYANNPLFTQQHLSFFDDIEEGSRVLDIGCGFGFETSYLLFKGAKVVGTDFSPTALQTLSRKSKSMGKGISLVVGDLHNPCLADGGFDYIVASQIFNRGMVDAERVLREHSCLLKRGGEVYVADYVKFDATLGGGLTLEDLGQARMGVLLPTPEEEFRYSLKDNDALNALKKLGYETEVMEGNVIYEETRRNTSCFPKGYLIKGKKKD